MSTPDFDLIQEQKRFYAISIPHTKEFELQLAFVNKDFYDEDNQENGFERFLPFEKLHLKVPIPYAEELVLFEKSITFNQSKQDKSIVYSIEQPEGLIEITSYKVRAELKKVILDDHHYYEKDESVREIPPHQHIFIFNMNIDENDHFSWLQRNNWDPVLRSLKQNLYFMLSFIETKKFDLLSDFIVQYQQYFTSVKTIERELVDEFYRTLDKYLDKKPVSEIEGSFETMLILTCIYGLLPRTEKSFLDSNYKPTNLKLILKAVQVHAERLADLQTKLLIYGVFIQGLTFIFTVEEHRLGTSHWLDTIQKLTRDRILLNTVVQRFITQASLLEANIERRRLVELHKVSGHLTLLTSNYLNFCKTLLEFYDMTKDVIISNFEHDQRSSRSFVSQEDATQSQSFVGDGGEVLLPRILSEKQSRKFGDLKLSLEAALERYFRRNKNPGHSLTLEMTAHFFRSMAKDPSYLASIFRINKNVSETVCSLLKKTCFEDETSLELLFTILIEPSDALIIIKLDVPKFLIEALSKSPANGSSRFCFKFFSLFVTHPSFNEATFEALLSKWLSYFKANANILLESFDELYALFMKNDRDATQKKKLFISKIISSLTSDDLANKLSVVVQLIKNEDFSVAYKEQYLARVIYKEPQYLLSWNCLNPLQHIRDLLHQHPLNQLVQDLRDACIHKIPTPSRDDVLKSLFDKPTKESLTYMVLDIDVFKGTPLHHKIHQICLQTIKEMQANTIEVKWILCTEKLDSKVREIMRQQIKHVVEENNVKVRQTGELLDIEQLLEACQRECKGRVSMVNNIQNFIITYCLEAEDCNKQIDVLRRIKHSIEEKKVIEVDCPSHLMALCSYAEKLNPIEKLSSFGQFRRKNRGDLQAATCLEEAKLVEELLQKYEVALIAMIDDFETTVKDVTDFFAKAKNNYEREIELLSNIVDKAHRKYLRELLKFISEEKYTKKTCYGIKLCVRSFGLKCDINDIIEAGCNFSRYPSAKVFHEVNKTIAKYFNFEENKRVLDLLAEFMDTDELLRFTLDRTDKSEVDFMKEAINDYDSNKMPIQVVFDFATFWSFITELNTSIKGKSLKEFLRHLNELMDEAAYANIIADLKSCRECYYEIQNLYFDVTHKEESKRKQIFKIVEDSSLIFLLDKESLDITLKYTPTVSEKPDIRYLDLAQISELRDRAHLIIHTESSNKNAQENTEHQREELDKSKTFCSFADTITQIISILTRLQIDGYPELKTLVVASQETLISETCFICVSNKFDALYNFKVQLEETLPDWNNSIIRAYKSYYELTYLKGKDFWRVEETLIEPKIQESSVGAQLLNYIGKEPVQSELDVTLSPEKRLNHIGEALKNLPDLIKRPKYNRSQSCAHNFTFFVIETSEKAIIKGMLTLFLRHEEAAVPSAFQTLICHQSTPWNELMAFVYRCFFSPQQRLFCLVQPERLNFALQDQVFVLLNSLNSNYPYQKFYLAIVTTDMTTSLVASLRTERQTETLKSCDLIESDMIKEQIFEVTRDCRVILSTLSGLGKSSRIKHFAHLDKTDYNKVPISGTIDPIDIGERLSAIFAKKKSILWIDIGSVAKKDRGLLNEIIFCLVVLRSFHFSKSVVKIPIDAKIFFEIESSSFQSLDSDFEMLTYLHKIEINSLELQRLDYQSHKIQFVCYYLEALKNKLIASQDIFRKDVDDNMIPAKECIDLLMPVFLKNHEERYASYTQLNIYINMLYALFKGFSESPFSFEALSVSKSRLLKGEKVIKDNIIMKTRLNLAKALLLAADQFTSKSVENIRKNQRASIHNSIAQTQIINSSVISWEDTRPFTVVFGSDDSPIFVYKSIKDIPEGLEEIIQSQKQTQALIQKTKSEEAFKEYKYYSQNELFMKLVSLTNKLYNRSVCLKCFRKYERSDKTCSVCKGPLLINKTKTLGGIDSSVISTSSAGSKDSFNIQDFLTEVAEKSKKTYALTSDNFLKLLLVFMRAQQKIPVIIMGETGCGKTSLIRFLCTRILDDEFQAFSIHSGIDQSSIIQQMSTYIKDSKRLRDKNLWIFFDEFNTTQSIGLIKEIMCERTMLGTPLPENMIFLGACNPLRLKSQRMAAFDKNVGINKARLNQLVNYKLLYTVYPLPETMIEYVWDYGHLDEETEQKYIQAIFSDLDVGDDLKSLIVNLVCAAHKKFKSWEDVSSVSLRDIARYKILYKWFFKSCTARDKKQTTNLQNRAAILAFLHCYYLRISSIDNRNELLIMIEPNCKKLGMTKEAVEELLYNEEMDFLSRMTSLPEDVAKNRALRENIFALIVCILTKIPIFICGKPGCSKSLAVQLVFNHLKGESSQDEYFKTEPELIPVFYQGSENSTSEGILTAFDRAEKYLGVHMKDKKILPVVVFDEIGLAEISNNNPLKVLHSKLEIEDIKVAFVGISNWRLDASKMNRALYLARPDPSQEDLKEIANVICDDFNLNSQIVESLARIYCDLREKLKEKDQGDVFGLRDFYFLIKGIKEDLLELERNNKILEESETIYSVIRRNIKRNFSGLDKEYEYLWHRFCLYLAITEKEYQLRDPLVRDLILDNLKSKNSRYLMLITQSDCASEYIEEAISNRNRIKSLEQQSSQRSNIEDRINHKVASGEVKTLVGSHMADDSTDQSYGYRVLSDIILYVERGYTIVLKKMNNTYSSLYDLFNQNFMVIGGKKYSKIALGALCNPKCFVHEDFRCIIFMSETEVANADPPLLNRFEKHRLRIEDVLTENERILHRKLVMWILSITVCDDDREQIRKELIFVNYNIEHLYSLILSVRDNLDARKADYSDNDIIDICKKKLIKITTFDFTTMVSLNVHDEAIRRSLLESYYEVKSQKFEAYCQQIVENEEGVMKSIVYTYTPILSEITYPDKTPVRELKLKNFRSEMEIVDEIKHYISSKNRLLVIRVELAKESKHLLLLKHLLQNFVKTPEYPKGRHLMIVIHLERCNVGGSSMDTLFHNWESITFDDLNSEFVLPSEFIERPTLKKLRDSKLVTPLKNSIEQLLPKCLSRIRHSTTNTVDENMQNERRKKILKDIRKNGQELIKLICQRIDNMVNQDHTPLGEQDWRNLILGRQILDIAISPIAAMNLALAEYYSGFLMNIVYKLEQECLLDTYFDAVREENKELISLWHKSFQKLELDVNEQLDQKIIEVDCSFTLKFPFSTFEANIIEKIQDRFNHAKDNKNLGYEQTNNLDALKASSFFGAEFYSLIFKHEEIYKKFLHDQVYLYLARNKLKVETETAILILDKMHINNPIQKLQYFLASAREFSLILGVVEALLGLRQGEDILSKILKGFYDLNVLDLSATDVKNKDLPKYLLIHKDKKYYQIERERFSPQLKLEGETPFENDPPFPYFFFANILSEISSCSYLAKYSTIADIKSIFMLIEEKIIKTMFYPDNMETFRPWIDLMRFIEDCDKSPDLRFQSILKQFNDTQTEDIFLNIKSVQELINDLTTRSDFFSSLDEVHKHRRILKLKTQLYKNLVSNYDSEVLVDVIDIIDKDKNLCKSSAKVIDLLDHHVDFSEAIIKMQGKIDICENYPELKILEEKILRKSSDKIHILLVNRAFVTIEANYHSTYKDFLTIYYPHFMENLIYLQRRSKMSKSNEPNEVLVVSFLGVIAWLRVYMHFYARALEKNDQDTILGDIQRTLDPTQSETEMICPEAATLQLYVLKCLKLGKNEFLKDVRDQYRRRQVNWINLLLENRLKADQDDIIPLIPLAEKKYLHDVDTLLNDLLTGGPSVMARFVNLCQAAKHDYTRLLCIYSWFIRFYVKQPEAKLELKEKFKELLEVNKELLVAGLKKMGYKFICLLLGNFTPESFLYLKAGMSPKEMYQRTVLVSVLAGLIAQKHNDANISSFLFDYHLYNKPESNSLPISIDDGSNLSPLADQTLRFLRHATIFGLYEGGFINEKEIDNLSEDQTKDGRIYFESNFKQDYHEVEKLIGSNNAYIWIYQVLLSVDKLKQQKGYTKSSKTPAYFAQGFEEIIINPMTQSVTSTIQAYHKVYLAYENSLSQDDVALYIDEIKTSDKKYPFSKYFNYVKAPTFEDLSHHFSFLKNSSEALPLLDYALRKHEDLANVSLLPAIVDFSNLLMKKYNYQISRDDANKMKLQEVLKDGKLTSDELANFKSAWDKLTLKKALHNHENKALAIEDYPLSCFLVRTTKSEGDSPLLEIMMKLATLQNEFIYLARKSKYLSKTNEAILEEQKSNLNTIQAVKQDQVLDVSKEWILKAALKLGYTYDYEYGLGREILYDFEEIESSLQQEVNRMRLFDDKKLSLMRYQFELYPESASIITNVRAKNPQEILDQNDRSESLSLLSEVVVKDRSAFLGSLDYVLTYLQNKKEDGNQSIAEFCKAQILDYKNLSEYVYSNAHFSKIKIKNIVDLYELVEEVIFDKTTRETMPAEYQKSTYESQAAVDNFKLQTFGSENDTLYPKLKEPATLTRVFKRLIYRTLNAKVSSENKLMDYFVREDMWEEGTDMDKIRNMDFSKEIKLKHAFLILKAVEEQLASLSQRVVENSVQIQEPQPAPNAFLGEATPSGNNTNPPKKKPKKVI